MKVNQLRERIEIYVGAIVSELEASSGPKKELISQFEFQMLCAGYDDDGSQKLQKIKMKFLPSGEIAPDVYKSTDQDGRVRTVEERLVHLSAGIDWAVNARLDAPKAFATEPELHLYAPAIKKKVDGDLDLLEVEKSPFTWSVSPLGDFRKRRGLKSGV